MEYPVSKLNRLDESARERSEGPEAADPPAVESLQGWLRWIHVRRSDATLHVRTDGGNGTIWCRGGEIIDAEWEGRVAEGALREMLVRSSAAATLDFAPVERPCRILTPTHHLLHVAEARHSAPPPAPMQGRPQRKDRFTELVLPLAHSVPPIAGDTPSQPPPPSRAWQRRGGYLGAFLVAAGLAALGFSLGRLGAEHDAPPPPTVTAARLEPAAPPVHTAPTEPAAPSPRAASPPIIIPTVSELPSIPFVRIQVEPAEAEIWLDRQLASRGAVQIAAISDGMLHELRFTAPGHETKTLYFRDTPPAGRVFLTRIPDPKSAEPKSAEPKQASAAASPTSEAPKKGAPRARTTPAGPAPAAAKPVAARSPKVELIEAHTPRVQLLD